MLLAGLGAYRGRGGQLFAVRAVIGITARHDVDEHGDGGGAGSIEHFAKPAAPGITVIGFRRGFGLRASAQLLDNADERRRILGMVENGEISVAEAEQQLANLANPHRG